jgi:FkbM family methyltransferase
MSVQEAFRRAVELLPEEPVVVEVGSHVGDGVRYILERRPNAVIYAIEPGHESFESLHSFHKRSYRLAIADGSPRRLAKKGTSRQYRMVPAKNADDQMTLDEFIKIQRIEHIDLLRFDCYGSEYAIFRVSSRFLSIADMVCVTMHKEQVLHEIVDVRPYRKHIKGCLKRSGFERICTFGKGARKHVFQLWRKR